MNINNLIDELEKGQFDETLTTIYVDESKTSYQRQRYIKALEMYQSLYGDDDIQVFSTAGRSEVSGNHTDHQHGRVLAASINLDAIAVASKNDNYIKVVSDDFDIVPIYLDELDKKDYEMGTSEALIRGVTARLQEDGYKIGGFTAYATSDVLMGAGLSSSAAFEGLIGTIISGLYNDMSIDMVTIAKAGQYAENVYFGKPCGLMDQCACAVGGLIAIDFKNPKVPEVKHVDIDFSQFHHSLCIVDTKGSHANLTHEYAAIPEEMKSVAAYFNKEVLADVDPADFFEHLSFIRQSCGDRAVLRAFHFFKENERVPQIVTALENKDFTTFKKLIKASGQSSYQFLQNVFAISDPQNQAVSLALALSEDILGEHGVCRVHGGGFAGTIQAFVEDDYVPVYKKQIEQYFGSHSCHVLKIRPNGGMKVF